MLIPCALIAFDGTNGASGTRVAPAYVAKLIRSVWGPRLSSLAASDIPLSAPDRYREVSSVTEEENLMRAEFGEHYERGFPNGLRSEIEVLLESDAELREAAARIASAPVVAHDSFLMAGCTEAQALAIQSAGYLTLADLPHSFMQVAEIATITPDLARALIKAAAAKPAKPVKAANPVAVPTAGAT